MKYSVLTIMMIIIGLLTPSPSAAYFTDFTGFPDGALVNDIDVPGMSFNGQFWRVTYNDPAFQTYPTIEGNTISGVQLHDLEIQFDEPQYHLSFDFAIPTVALPGMSKSLNQGLTFEVAVTTHLEGVEIGTRRFYAYELRVAEHASLTLSVPFDMVVISQHVVGSPNISSILMIDNISTSDSPSNTHIAYYNINHVQVNWPGVVLHESAGGEVLRSVDGWEMWVPNQNSHNPNQDTYDVLDQTEIDGVTWVQISVGGPHRAVDTHQ